MLVDSSAHQHEDGACRSHGQRHDTQPQRHAWSGGLRQARGIRTVIAVRAPVEHVSAALKRRGRTRGPVIATLPSCDRQDCIVTDLPGKGGCIDVGFAGFRGNSRAAFAVSRQLCLGDICFRLARNRWQGTSNAKPRLCFLSALISAHSANLRNVS